MDLNVVALTGRLTRDVESKTTQNGTQIAQFGMAVGGYKDKVAFVDCVAFGKSADSASRFLRKGSRIGVKGSLNYETWTSVEGFKRSKISVNVDSFIMLEKRGEQSQPANSTAGITGKNDGDIPF